MGPTNEACMDSHEVSAAGEPNWFVMTWNLPLYAWGNPVIGHSISFNPQSAVCTKFLFEFRLILLVVLLAVSCSMGIFELTLDLIAQLLVAIQSKYPLKGAWHPHVYRVSTKLNGSFIGPAKGFTAWLGRAINAKVMRACKGAGGMLKVQRFRWQLQLDP